MMLRYSCASLICMFIALASCEKEVILPDDTSGYTQYGTPLDSVPQTSDIIMYEVNLRAFSNTGDLQGVTAGLGHISSLAVNTIWLMPIYQEGELNAVNSPYCIRDFKSVSEEYGTIADLRTLVDSAHARGMTVILDWVANHTSWDNPWIVETDWYSQDASGNIIHPPGTTWTDVADLNFNNFEMRAAMIDAMKYWVLEANIDGYRCDYADGVPDDFWKQAIDSLRAIPGRSLIMLAEGAKTTHFNSGFDMTYGWDYYSELIDVYNGEPVSNLYVASNNEYAALPVDKERLRFTTNHDESAWNATPMTLFDGVAGATAATVMTVFQQGVPLIYTGQEVGRESNVSFFSNTPINWTAHPDMLQAYRNIFNTFAGLPVARYGTMNTYSHNDMFCIRKVLNEEELAVLVNPRNIAITYTLPTVLKNTTWQNALTNDSVSLFTEIVLDPYAYLILVK